MRRRLPELLLILASLGLGLGMVELALRGLYGPPVRLFYPQEHYVEDPEIGHWLAPEQHAYSHDQLVETNRNGLRDRDFEREVPVGGRRIVALGDSQTYGEGLPLAETWPKQLEAALAARDGAGRWEVVNAGISGTDTWQHERVLRRVREHYRFDLAVLGLYVNDVTPIYVPEAAALRTNTLSRRVGYVLKRSALVTLLWSRYRLRAGGVGDTERHILRGEPNPLVEEGWAQVERSLAAMKTLSDEASAELIVAVIPRRDQVDGSEPGAAFDRRALEIGARADVDVVDLLEPLRAAYRKDGHGMFIPWDGHNAAPANRVIARELARALPSARATSSR